MKNVLVICAYRDSVDRVLLRVSQRVQVRYFRTANELKNLFSMDSFEAYDLVIVAPFNWRLPYTATSMTRRCRDRFSGPVVAVCSEKGWADNAVAGGASHVIKDLNEGMLLLEQLLFPSTTEGS